MLSDRLGRSRMYAWASILTALSCYPAFLVMQQGAHNIYLVWAAIAIPFGIIYAAVYGTVSVFLCDLFDARVRYTGISFVYQVSSITAGGLTPIVATLLLTYGGGDPIYIAAYVLASGVLSSICAFAIARRQKAGLVFDDDVVHDVAEPHSSQRSTTARRSTSAQRA